MAAMLLMHSWCVCVVEAGMVFGHAVRLSSHHGIISKQGMKVWFGSLHYNVQVVLSAGLIYATLCCSEAVRN